QEGGQTAAYPLVVVEQKQADHRSAPSIGTDHRRHVPWGWRSVISHVPSNLAARSQRLASPLRFTSSGMPTPSSTTSTVTRSPVASIMTSTVSSFVWRFTFDSA